MFEQEPQHRLLRVNEQYRARRRVPTLPLTASVRIYLAGFALELSPGRLAAFLKFSLVRQSTGIAEAETVGVLPVEAATEVLSYLLLSVGAALLSGYRLPAVGWGAVVAFLALVVACAILGGHVQACAHVLIATGLYVLWRLGPRDVFRRRGRGWILGVSVGIALAAIEIAPLACYLARSPVWTDRVLEKKSPWTISRPRLLDALCTATPYLYGSQRRGQPNLARAIGVHNLNESAGGFAGLITLIWLAPLGIASRRERPIARFLTPLLAIGFCGAFEIPPVANFFRAVPVLDVIDQRRLTLWVSFCLVFLGAIGLDRLGNAPVRRRWEIWIACWFLASIAFGTVAVGVKRFEPTLRAKAAAHFSKTLSTDPSDDPAVLHRKIDRQVAMTVHFVERYYGYVAFHLLVLAVAGMAWRRGRLKRPWVESFAIGAAMLDLVGFGVGLNPAIDRRAYRPQSEVIEYLRKEVSPPARIVGVGAELPPNTLLRFGLADVRNYDSIESTRSLSFLDSLFEPEPGRRERTSRRLITWSSVLRARSRLKDAGVSAVVGATPPPLERFDRVDRIGRVWVARWNCPLPNARFDDGLIEIDATNSSSSEIRVLPVTFDPGWRGATEDGLSVRVEPWRDVFLAVKMPRGAKKTTLTYDPIEVRLGLWISATAACMVCGWASKGFVLLAKNRLLGLERSKGSG